MANPGSSQSMAQTGSQVEITVELFGTARIACGRRDMALRLSSSSTLAEVTQAMGEACPELVGLAIDEDLSALMKSYTLNLNGTAFVSGPATRSLELRDGDTLLLFSSQAGG